ncbi:hypothetical protein ACFHWW_33405 [Ensifer sp. P24N7]|uniref:hypothetical protein n=1 Tax=Sinorhizobium sp. P24N7 TaxID=3348358 RepID=UPI0035F25D5F
MWQLDEVLDYELDADFTMVMKFIKEISETRSIAVLNRAEELREKATRAAESQRAPAARRASHPEVSADVICSFDPRSFARKSAARRAAWPRLSCWLPESKDRARRTRDAVELRRRVAAVVFA